MKCRHCQHELKHIFANLWHQPASNSFLSAEQLKEPENTFPLLLYVCENCFLVQVDEHKNCEEIFNQDYVYFSSMSVSWLAHAKAYVEMMRTRFNLDDCSQVVEIASNDGYLLQYFKELHIPCFGIEPSKNTADVARQKGIESLQEFFGLPLATQLAEQKKKADVILGNNVIAHVPDINDFAKGVAALLKEDGVATFEFPHVLKLIEENQFDTIYQEHYSYLSLYSLQKIFAQAQLRIFDVEKLSTHGGSLRVFATHAKNTSHGLTENVQKTLAEEEAFGLLRIARYTSFQENIENTKNALLQFLLVQKQNGKKVAAYGAAAKGNTFLNLCGVKPDLVQFCVDKAQSKQNKFMPGSHIPVYDLCKINEERPDFILILPWNIKDEIMQSLSFVKQWGGRFVIAIPQLRVH